MAAGWFAGTDWGAGGRAYEESRWWVVESVEEENKCFDLISKRSAAANTEYPVETRYIEVKGRAKEGIVALSGNEYATAYRLRQDYWLYVVFNCGHDVDAGPDIYPIQDPARMPWEPMREVVQYRVDAKAIMDEAAKRPQELNQVQLAFQEAWSERIADYGRYNILVEGSTDKIYLDLAAALHREATGIDLLDGGAIRIIAGPGTTAPPP